jgi:hypothetical protein
MTLKHLPTHATLVDPFDGLALKALGFKRNGAPIWPAMGGSQPVADPPAPAPTDPAPTPDPSPQPPSPTASAPTDQLGDAGKKAIAEERDRATAERKRANELQAKFDMLGPIGAQLAELESLKPLALALSGKAQGNTKTDLELLTERLTAQEQAIAEQRDEAAKERLLRIRLEVAQEKGLTKAQAARLTGTTAEELAADADELLALFPAPVVVTPPAADPKTPAPKPDPSQGARGEAPTRSSSLAAAIGAEMAQRTA